MRIVPVNDAILTAKFARFAAEGWRRGDGPRHGNASAVAPEKIDDGDEVGPVDAAEEGRHAPAPCRAPRSGEGGSEPALLRLATAEGLVRKLLGAAPGPEFLPDEAGGAALPRVPQRRRAARNLDQPAEIGLVCDRAGDCNQKDNERCGEASHRIDPTRDLRPLSRLGRSYG
jgi:hypothetical protein